MMTQCDRRSRSAIADLVRCIRGSIMHLHLSMKNCKREGRSLLYSLITIACRKDNGWQGSRGSDRGQHDGWAGAIAGKAECGRRAGCVPCHNFHILLKPYPENAPSSSAIAYLVVRSQVKALCRVLQWSIDDLPDDFRPEE